MQRLKIVGDMFQNMAAKHRVERPGPEGRLHDIALHIGKTGPEIETDVAIAALLHHTAISGHEAAAHFQHVSQTVQHVLAPQVLRQGAVAFVGTANRTVHVLIFLTMAGTSQREEGSAAPSADIALHPWCAHSTVGG